MSSKAIAVVCSDIHLCHTCPPARASEPDWYAAMARVLRQLRYSSKGLPILCCGDVFDRWNSPPELINFAYEHLPEMIAVPGQHDLPNHSLEDIKRSAFWTLCEMGKIVLPSAGFIVLPTDPPMRVFPFPWGCEICSQEEDEMITVALCHRYVWMRGRGYPGAGKEQLAGNVKVKGYDVMCFGDNHQTFDCRIGPTNPTRIVNPGCLIRRRQDERREPPSIYAIHQDASVKRIELDVGGDLWSEADEEPRERDLDVSMFADELREMSADSLDFESAIRLYFESNKVAERTRNMILQSIGASDAGR